MSNGNGTVPPVCPISRSQVVPGQPGLGVTPIPHAYDLPSALAALRQIQAMLPQLLGQQARPNNLYPPNSLPGLILLALNNTFTQDAGGKAHPPNYKQSFKETNRFEDRVTIEDPDNSDNWVVVERINMLEFTDSVSGHQLTFTMG